MGDETVCHPQSRFLLKILRRIERRLKIASSSKCRRAKRSPSARRTHGSVIDQVIGRICRPTLETSRISLHQLLVREVFDPLLDQRATSVEGIFRLIELLRQARRSADGSATATNGRRILANEVSVHAWVFVILN